MYVRTYHRTVLRFQHYVSALRCWDKNARSFRLPHPPNAPHPWHAQLRHGLLLSLCTTTALHFFFWLQPWMFWTKYSSQLLILLSSFHFTMAQYFYFILYYVDRLYCSTTIIVHNKTNLIALGLNLRHKPTQSPRAIVINSYLLIKGSFLYKKI